MMLGTALAASLALPAAAQDADTVVATVNGTDITLGHMAVLAERLPEQYSQLPDQALFDGILDQLVQQTALADQKEELSRRGELVIENERRALFATEVLESVSEQAVSDEAIQQMYDENYANGEGGTEYNASHILVETEEEAQSLIEELDGGADFAELARENSTGPSGPNGGELGWFGDGMMVEPFQNAVAELETGDVSEPVQTQFGWHVIKLNETRDQEAPSLDEVRDEIAAQIQQTAVQEMIDEATASAEVERPETPEIDPSVVRDSALFD